MNIIEMFSANNDCYKNNLKKADNRYVDFQKNGPKKLMLHSVGTPQPSALVFANSWNNPGKEVAVHAVLQADGTVYQCLPWNYRGWHAGGSANNNAIGVEMTEPAEIRYTGGSTFTVLDAEKARAQCRGTYRTAVDLFAYLCLECKLDPDTDILSHKEGCDKGVASNHGDPEHLWKGLGLEYTMNGFRKDVEKKLAVLVAKEQEAAIAETLPAPAPVEHMYRIRKSWDDKDSQIGAYHNLENAIADCEVGYKVFDENGNVLYVHPNTPPAWAAEACQKAIEKEIFQGDNHGMMNWENPVTRAQMAVILNRLGLLD